MSSYKLLVSYEHKAQKVKKTLHLFRLRRNKDVLIVEDQTTNTPKMLRSPIKNIYMFVDGGEIFILDGTTLDVNLVSSPLMRVTRQIANESMISNWNEQAAWSHQGDKITYLAQTNKHSEIWVFDLLKSKQTLVYETCLQIGLYGWTYEGELIIWEGLPSCLKLISVEGQHLSTIKLNNIHHSFHSPDGERLVFTIEREPKIIYMYCFKEQKTRKILSAEEGGEFVPQINFSTDGKRIVTIEEQNNLTRYIKTYEFDTEYTGVIKVPSIYKYKVQVPIWFNEHSFILSSRRYVD